MAAGAIVNTNMGELGILCPPTSGAVTVRALVVVVVFGGRRMAAQTVITSAIVAETDLAPIAGVVTGRALTNIMPSRCRVAGGAVR
jgi:hypothetical protein